MSLWSIGSVQEHLGNIVGWANIPSSISGTTLNNIIEQEINFINQRTSDTINNDAIIAKYQPPLIDLSLSKLLFSIESNQGGVDNIKLGDLSINAGNSSMTQIATKLREDAIMRLKELQIELHDLQKKKLQGCHLI